MIAPKHETKMTPIARGTIDPLRYYDLESYLFNDVRSNFHEHGKLSDFEFFSIVIWKANRAKSLIANRLLKKRANVEDSLDVVVEHLSREIFSATDARQRLQILMQDWGFRLPMASTLLTVLWPDDFTVYDVRACEQLKDFEKLANLTDFDRIWVGYTEFVAAVRRVADEESISLRDADRYLWGASALAQLKENLKVGFART